MNTNKNYKVLTWSSHIAHGQKFKQIYEVGYFTEKTAAQNKMDFDNPFNEIVTGLKNEANTRASCGSEIMIAMFNFEKETEMGICASAEDPNFLSAAGDNEDPTDAVSSLSMNDNIIYGSQITSFCSILSGRSSNARDNRASSEGNGEHYGCTTMMLPYILNSWDNLMERGCISIQVHVPSGINIENKLKYHLSRSQRDLILMYPISHFLTCSDFF
eukprot:1189144-Ditylum_brightwellii.AAC.1